MTPLTVFFRTLMKSSAIFVGAGYIMLHPSLDLRSTARGGVTAQKSPAEAAVDGLVAALKDSDPGVRRQAAAALGADRQPPRRARPDRAPQGQPARRPAAGGLGAGSRSAIPSARARRWSPRSRTATRTCAAAPPRRSARWASARPSNR